MTKRIGAFALALVMVICLLPIGAFAAEGTYFVAGTSSLCGSNWANNDPANQMELNSEGLYEKTFADVPAGTP